MDKNEYELLIIGGGPIGLACGLEARKAKVQYIILEKGALTNSLFNYPLNMSFFSTSERLEIGGIPFVSNHPKPNRPEALEYYRRVAVDNHVNIHLQEEVKEIKKEGDWFHVTTSRDQYTARFVILATGFYDIPVYLGVPGEELPKVMHYYKDPHFYAMQKVLVVGASNSAVDAALETYRKGARVTIVVRGPDIGERVKYWVRPDMMNRIKEGSIKTYFNSTVKEIKEKEVVITTPDGEETIPNDYVIALTGYRPNFEFLRKVGIRLSDDEKMQPEYDPDTMETNVSGLFLAGVICGGMETHIWFIENSREHAQKIINYIREKR
jgi:thioredoxin reductase (NADPH)